MPDDLIATWAHENFGDDVPSLFNVPLAGVPGEESWSLCTGLLMVSGFVLFLVALVHYQRESREWERTDHQPRISVEDDKRYGSVQRMFLGQLIALALVGFVIFMITENPTRPAVLLDQYSLMMLLPLVAEIFILSLSSRRRREAALGIPSA
jgi:Ca2+/Na+ antiporter